MLERKKLLAGIFATLLSLNLCGSAQAATDAEKEEARMWGGFRDKLSCTVESSVTNDGAATEKVVVKEVVVPVYRYPFIFIWDDWYHWGRWHHHHHYHPAPRPPRPHIGRPIPNPPRPGIGRPAPGRPGKPAIVKPGARPGRPTVGKPAARPNRPAISKPSSRPGGRQPVMRPAGQQRPRPQVKSAPRSRDEQMIFQNGGPRGGRQHAGGPRGGRAPRRR